MDHTQPGRWDGRERLLARVRGRVERFAALRDPAAVLEPGAASEVEALLTIVPDLDHDLEVAYLAGMFYCSRYLATGSDESRQDLDTCLGLLRPVVAALPEVASSLTDVLDRDGPQPSVATVVTEIRAGHELREALGTGDLSKLDSAIDGLSQALGSAPHGPDGQARKLASLGRALLARFEWAGERADLDAAIDAERRAVLATPDGDARRAERLTVLSMALRTRSSRAGRLADLQAAVGIAREAARRSAHDQRDRVVTLASLGLALTVRFERTGHIQDLEAGIVALQDAVANAGTDHPERVTLLSNLCGALRTRFERTGDPMALDAAITAGQDAVRATPPGHPRQAGRLSNLSLALRDRFDLTGDLADLEAAVSTGQEAAERTPEGHPDWAGMVSNLSLALGSRYRRTGQSADLDAAIAARRDVLRASPTDDPDRPGMMTNLSMALLVRSHQTGDHADLNAAVALCRDAVSDTPANHPDRAPRLSNLSTALLARFRRTEDHADLDAAVTAGQAAVHATPRDHTMYAGRLANLSVILRNRFLRTEDPADIDRAVATAQGAARAVPADHVSYAGMQSSLCNSLLARFDYIGDPADLDAAVAAGQDAVRATPPDHPERASRLFNLSRAHAFRFDHAETAADLDAAIDAAREAAASELGPPQIRAVAARMWGRAAGAARRWPLAVAGFEVAVALLDRVAPRSLIRSDQEYVLDDLDSLASDAAACCVQAGHPQRAVELLDQGRGVLLGQSLDTRTDLTALVQQHPALAQAFMTLRDELDQADAPPEYLTAPPAETANRNIALLLERRRAVADAFGQVITDIRDQPGFADFLRPLPIADLAAAAAEGPVVIINVSQFGSHALTLTSGGLLDPVPLPDLTPDSVDEHLSEFLTLVEDHHGSPAAGQRLTAVLGWLWDAATAPVLDQLEVAGPPPSGEAWPRLWWCVPGLLSFLPLHAAGYHGTRRHQVPQTVIDRVASSYTPTVRALIHAKRARSADRAPPERERVLVVAMPHTPGAPDLPAATAEAVLLEQNFPGRVRKLTGPAATRDSVLKALPQAPWVHLACHGFADMANPSASRLLLADHHRQPLSVTDIARLRLVDADLAVLSACSTARPGAWLTDEAIHLVSAFQLAGYRHVVGTLWPISDRITLRLSSDLYSSIALSGTVSTAPIALHEATRRLRDRHEHNPFAWASYIHSGA